jgi:hypothetical protein
VVLLICFYILLSLEGLALFLVGLVLSEIDRLSKVLYWAAIILGGSTIVGFFSWVMFSGTAIVVKASQLVWRSKRGTRYIVLGAVYAVIYALLAIGLLAGYVTGGNVVDMIIYCITSLALIFIGKGIAADDGGPPSKREILQAKLDKLGEQEQGRHIEQR